MPIRRPNVDACSQDLNQAVMSALPTYIYRTVSVPIRVHPRTCSMTVTNVVTYEYTSANSLALVGSDDYTCDYPGHYSAHATGRCLAAGQYYYGSTLRTAPTRAIAEQLGVPVNVTPHIFRQSCATELLRAGAGMYHVKDLLGHESLETLRHYAKLTIRDLKKEHQRGHPRERDTREIGR